jgi:hypothetical protein
VAALPLSTHGRPPAQIWIVDFQIGCLMFNYLAFIIFVAVNFGGQQDGKLTALRKRILDEADAAEAETAVAPTPGPAAAAEADPEKIAVLAAPAPGARAGPSLGPAPRPSPEPDRLLCATAWLKDFDLVARPAGPHHSCGPLSFVRGCL